VTRHAVDADTSGTEVVPGTCGENCFDAQGLQHQVIPVGRTIAQISSQESPNHAADSNGEECFIQQFVPSGLDSGLTEDSPLVSVSASARDKHTAIIQKEIRDLEQRRVMIRNEVPLCCVVWRVVNLNDVHCRDWVLAAP